MPDQLLSETGIRAGMNLSFDVLNGTVFLGDGTGQRILFSPGEDKIFLGYIQRVYLLGFVQILATSHNLQVEPMPDDGTRFKRFLFLEP